MFTMFKKDTNYSLNNIELVSLKDLFILEDTIAIINASHLSSDFRDYKKEVRKAFLTIQRELKKRGININNYTNKRSENIV